MHNIETASWWENVSENLNSDDMRVGDKRKKKKKCYQLLCQRQAEKKNCATTRIGREIWCLPYAGLFH